MKHNYISKLSGRCKNTPNTPQSSFSSENQVFYLLHLKYWPASYLTLMLILY